MSGVHEAGQQMAGGGLQGQAVQPAPDVQPAYEGVDENPIRPLAIVNTLLRRRWIIVGVAGVITTYAIVASLLAQPVFTATAKFLPSQSAAISARMGGIIEGQPNIGVRDDPSTDYYVALVQSPSFMRAVALREYKDTDGTMKSLVTIYNAPGSTDAERERRAVEWLGKRVNVSAARTTTPMLPRIITLECQAKSATLAADICSGILEEIRRHNNDVRGSKATQNREFVKSQLDTAKTELDAATEAFATFTARNRKIVSPALEADRDRLQRLLRVKEDVYNTLSRQLVLARIEEQETRASIEMIESPEPPLQRSAPARTRMVLIAGVVGLFLGCGTALAWDRLRKMDPSDPDTRELRLNIADIRDDAFRMTRLGRRSTRPVAAPNTGDHAPS
jgi:uncharacterized protein involved in exopolysaccharide biosynthesis